ncbi:ATP-binding protein [Roseomonas sp. HJA6]|uniref:ATP-binding protein n=1 Tax=Roseomonas alba TaxID=2846776 RepID=A0ABS7AFH3_9PROT|nr:ATP-binding protein [Neoroseomonas alba]MBW6400913.1 ATP-binding protein [Neoroseomonas alba]
MPAGATYRLILHEGTEALRAAQLAVAAFLRDQGAGPNTAARAELLLEELALNTLRHGFAAGGTPELVVTAWHDGAHAGLDFEDRGAPFDPTQAALPVRPGSLKDAPVGGLGVPLLRRVAAELVYKRTADGRNRLHLVLPAEDAVIG